jgi:hypothetical protein
VASKTFDLKQHHAARLERLWRRAPFVLRITEWKEFPVPVLVVKERVELDDEPPPAPGAPSTFGRQPKGSVVERGHIAGEQQRRCLPVFRAIVERVKDEAGVPLELQRYLTHEGLRLRVNLPLDEESGAKLALICRLQERVPDLERVELIARRVAQLTREEAAYWLTRTTGSGPDGNRWAISGLRILLGGQAGDAGVGRELERLRVRA